MHVLIIAQYFPPDLGGSATRAYNVAKGLVANDCTVTVVSAFPHYPHGRIPKEYKHRLLKIERLEGIRIIRTFILPLESRGLGRRLLTFISFIISSLFALPIARNIDVVWAANPDVVVMVPAMIYGRLKRKPVSLNVDDLSLEDLFDMRLVKEGSITSSLAKTLTVTSYRNAELITPISPKYIDTIVKYGIQRRKIKVVRGGVDLSVFKPVSTTSSTGKRRNYRVLYSGAFSIAYDFDQVLKAARILEDTSKGVEFIIQGGGELKDHIKTHIRELNLKNALLIDRAISRKEVADLIGKADVLILPLGDNGKPHLGISTKLYEYQAVGKPIICCSSGAPALYVSETNSGIVVRPKDHESIARSVLYLKDNPTVAKDLGENGRIFVENNLSIEKVGLEMMSLLKTLTCS